MFLRLQGASTLRLLSLTVALTSGFTCLALASTAAAQETAPKKPSAAAGATTPAAPPPPPAAPAPASAAAKPAEAAPEPEDKRAIYVSADIGIARSDLGAIKDNLGFDRKSANGYLAGLGIGYRFKELRIGARFRDTVTSEYSLRSMMGEIGYGLAFRPVSPVLFAHIGYMYSTNVERAVVASSLPKGNLLTPQVGLDGVVVGGELGASYWLTKFLRIGPFIGVDFTFLHRKQNDLPQSILPIDDTTKQKPLFSDSGSGVGFMLILGLRGTGDISF